MSPLHGDEERGEGVKGTGNQFVVGPSSAFVASDDTGINQDFEVMGDGGLSKIEGFGQVADACF